MALDGVYHEQATRSQEDHYLVSFNCVTHFLNIFFTCLLTSFLRLWRLKMLFT